MPLSCDNSSDKRGNFNNIHFLKPKYWPKNLHPHFHIQLNSCPAWPPKAFTTIKIHTQSPTQLGLHGSSRRSNGSGSQTLSRSPDPGSSPCVCDSNFLKNPQQAQHFSFYFYKNTTDLPHHTHTHTHTTQPLLRNTEQSLAITTHPRVWYTVLSDRQQAHKGSRGSFFLFYHTKSVFLCLVCRHTYIFSEIHTKMHQYLFLN